MTMRDLESSFWIQIKGGLFLFLGIAASSALLAEHPGLKTAMLLGIAVWSFCRFYYFAFYVIEKYVDPGFRFSGLFDFARHWLSRRVRRP